MSSPLLSNSVLSLPSLPSSLPSSFVFVVSVQFRVSFSVPLFFVLVFFFLFPFPIIILCFVIIIFVRPFLCLDYVLGVFLFSHNNNNNNNNKYINNLSYERDEGVIPTALEETPRLSADGQLIILWSPRQMLHMCRNTHVPRKAQLLLFHEAQMLSDLQLC